MIDEILRNNLIIREWVNGQLLPLNVSLVIATGLFLYRAFRASIANQVYVGGWQRFQQTRGVRASCALFWLFLADGIRAGAAWSILKLGAPAAQLVAAMFVVGGVMAILAGLRCSYIFTQEWAGHHYWIATVVVMVMFWMLTA